MEKTALVAAASGIAAHQIAFIRGEWHVQAPLVLRSYVSLFIIIIGFMHLKHYQDVLLSTATAFHFFSWHLVGLFGSIALYRLLFHPLRRFPGPPLAKLTKFWHVWHCRTSGNHLLLERLHEEYGGFVRTGPNELTVFHPDGLAAINKIEDMDRSEWYDLVHPSYSINTVRDKKLHDARRKIWESAFTSEAMRDYEQRIRQHAVNVEASIRSTACSPVDINAMVYRFAYSVMSDLAFGQHMDESDIEWQRAVRIIHTGLSLLGPLSPAPWIALLFFSFTWLPVVRDWESMMAFCRTKMAERVSLPRPPENRDIAAWLIEDAQRRAQLGTVEEKRWLDGDGFSVILAGSDTTASTLVFIFYHLAKTPHYQERIRQEISQFNDERRTCIRSEDTHLSCMNFKDLERLSFLNAFINETLRLHHPLPTAGARVVRNPCGITIGEQQIPFGTNVAAPRWSFGRCEAHYGRAKEFVPERWLNGVAENGLVLDRRALTPWSVGKWACLGKPVALFEMRYLISVLVKNFVISFPLDDLGEAVEMDCHDQVTAFPGRLKLIFKAL